MLQLKHSDFQIHSPRDARYKGWSADRMTLEGLREWANALLSKCDEVGLNCIAVSDHHDLLPGLVTLEVAYRTKSSVWVFPGMEVTTISGMQGLLLLDPSLFGKAEGFDLGATEAVANRVVGAIGQHIAGQPLTVTPWKELEGLKAKAPEERAVTFRPGPTERLSSDFEGLIKSLERQFKDRYLLLPNLERGDFDKNKHGVFENPAGLPLYREAGDWFVGGMVGAGKATNEGAIKGKVKEYGGRVVACLRTSDQRGESEKIWFADKLGKPEASSWLKLSEHSTTSIAQALISGAGRRVFQARPGEPQERLESLTITGASVFGKAGLTIQLSPYLNNIIGGRGSGKSLIVSALARLFGHDAGWEDIPPEQLLPWEARHMSLFAKEGPFAAPEVELAVEYSGKGGVRYRITMSAPCEPLVRETRLDMLANGVWTAISEGSGVHSALDFRPLFFLQGQMSAITGSLAHQDDLIELIEGPMRESRRKLRQDLELLAAAVGEGVREKRSMLQLHSRVGQLKAQIAQKGAERDAFLAAAKHGLDAEQQKLFAEAELIRKGKAAVESLALAVEAASSQITAVHGDLEDGVAASQKAIVGLRESTFGNRSTYIDHIVKAAGGLTMALANAQQSALAEIDIAEKQKMEFTNKVQGLLGRATELAAKEKSRKEAVQKAASLEDEIAGLRKLEGQTEQAIQKANRSGKVEAGQAAAERFKKVVKDYSDQLHERAKQLTAAPDIRLIVDIRPGGNNSEVLEALRKICAGCGVRDKTWKKLSDELQAAKSPASMLAELISSAIESFDDPKRKVPRPWERVEFSEAIFTNIWDKTDVNAWVELSVKLAEDRVDVRYNKGQGKAPIPILNASPGERAVELLKVALHSTESPLVIDQPEDDLDNHFLAEKLVELVQESKHRNQLIFVSHNANLVVHGDSEVVQVMEAGEDGPKTACSLKATGTIDQGSVCREIEHVMEGGRTAFERRRKKYHETLAPDDLR